MSESKKNKNNPCADEDATKRFKLDEAPFSQMPTDDNEIPPTDDDDEEEELASVDGPEESLDTEFFGLFRSSLGPCGLFGGLGIWSRTRLLRAAGGWSEGEEIDCVVWYVDANVLVLEKGDTRWKATMRCDGPMEWAKVDAEYEPQRAGLLCPFGLFFCAGSSVIHYPVISWTGGPSLIQDTPVQGLPTHKFHRVDFNVETSVLAFTSHDSRVYKASMKLEHPLACVECKQAQVAPGLGIFQSTDFFGDGGRWYWQGVVLRHPFGGFPRFSKFHAVIYESHSNTLRLVRNRDDQTCLVWRGVEFGKSLEFWPVEAYTGKDDPEAQTWLGLFKGRIIENEDSSVAQWGHVELIRDVGGFKAGETFARAMMDPLTGFISLAKTTDAHRHWKAPLDITKSDVEFAYDECPRNYYDEDEA